MTIGRDCACASCVGACKDQPGWFLPGEAERAAELIGMPFPEFAETRVILDSCDNPEAPDAPYVYAPRKIFAEGIESEAVRTPASQRRSGVCVFLAGDRCSIHAEKPYECRVVLACDYNDWGVRDRIEKKWIAGGAPLGMREER
jgi:Fe-S-cluster containining protein